MQTAQLMHNDKSTQKIMKSRLTDNKTTKSCDFTMIYSLSYVLDLLSSRFKTLIEVGWSVAGLCGRCRSTSRLW